MSDPVELTGTDNTSALYHLLQLRHTEAEELEKEFNDSLDSILTFLSVFSLFLIYTGYCLLEQSYSRFAKRHETIMKYLLIVCIGFACWFVWGYTITFGQSENKVMGTANLLGWGLWDDKAKFRVWVYGGACSVLPTLIIAMGLGEKAQLRGICIIAAFVGLLLYPLPAHWVYSDYGFFADPSDSPVSGAGNPPFLDYGNSLVLLMGGFGGMFIEMGSSNRRPGWAERSCSSEQAGDASLQFLATACIWFGWLFFVIGGNYSMHDKESAQQAVLAAVNLVLAPCMAGLGHLLLVQGIRCWPGFLHTGTCCGAMHAGLVIMVGSAGYVDPPMAIGAGLFTAPIHFVCRAVTFQESDASVGATAAYAVSGLLSTFLVPLQDGLTGANARIDGFRNVQVIALLVLWIVIPMVVLDHRLRRRGLLILTWEEQVQLYNEAHRGRHSQQQQQQQQQTTQQQQQQQQQQQTTQQTTQLDTAQTPLAQQPQDQPDPSSSSSSPSGTSPQQTPEPQPQQTQSQSQAQSLTQTQAQAQAQTQIQTQAQTQAQSQTQSQTQTQTQSQTQPQTQTQAQPQTQAQSLAQSLTQAQSHQPDAEPSPTVLGQNSDWL